MTRTPLKNLLLTALHMLICCAVSAAALGIQFILMKPAGVTVSSFIFSSELYRINPVMWILGAVLGFSGLTIAVRKLLRQDFCCACEQPAVWKLLWCVPAAIGTVLILACNVALLILILGLMSGITLGRNETLLLSCTWAFPAYVLVMLMILCIQTVRK